VHHVSGQLAGDDAAEEALGAHSAMIGRALEKG
jgi:hypothetical protein